MSIEVIAPGSLSTVQDMGRFGSQEFGFSPSGAADVRALKAVNMLLDNDPGEAAVEMTLGGMTVKFNEDCVFALTGAPDMPKLNGTEIDMYRAYAVQAGDTLVCGFAQNGARTYFGVAGGFDLPLVMGSRSTGMKFSVGGYQGRKLCKGDVIPLRASAAQLPGMHSRVLEQPIYEQKVTLRVVLGPQAENFPPEMRVKFLNNAYTVTKDADRMGIRLDGEPILASSGSDIISDATATGAIQIVNEGLPIILMQDRQTTGGYAKIACVISEDLPLAGQLMPGTTVHFTAVSPQHAQRLARRADKKYRRAYRKMNGREAAE